MAWLLELLVDTFEVVVACFYWGEERGWGLLRVLVVSGVVIALLILLYAWGR